MQLQEAAQLNVALRAWQLVLAASVSASPLDCTEQAISCSGFSVSCMTQNKHNYAAAVVMKQLRPCREPWDSKCYRHTWAAGGLQGWLDRCIHTLDLYW